MPEVARLCPRSLCRCSLHRQMVVRARHQRPVRPEDRVRLRLARPLPGRSKSKVETLNINPALSWEPTKNLTVGAGVSWQKVKAHADQQMSTTLPALRKASAGWWPADSFPRDSRRRSSASAAGLSPVPTSTATTTPGAGTSASCGKRRIRPASARLIARTIKYTANGTVSFNNPTAANLGPLPPDARAGRRADRERSERAARERQYQRGDSNCPTPPMCRFSISSTANGIVMADLQYTGWSSFQQLQVVREHRRRA